MRAINLNLDERPDFIAKIVVDADRAEMLAAAERLTPAPTKAVLSCCEPEVRCSRLRLLTRAAAFGLSVPLRVHVAF